MKMRTLICCVTVLAAQICSVSCYAYTRVTQSGTNEAATIKADGYSPYETVPVMILKADKTLTDLENATKDSTTVSITDVVGYMGSLSADKDGNINDEIEFAGFTPDNNYGVVVNGAFYKLKYLTNSDRNALIANMIYAADHNQNDILQNLVSANLYSLSIDNNVLGVCNTFGTEATNILSKEIKGKGTLTIDQMAEILNKTLLITALNSNKLNSLSDKEIVDHIFDSGKYADENSALEDKIKLTGLNNFISKINNKAYTSISDADTGMAKELILDAICYSQQETTTEILSILQNHNDVLGLALNDFNSLSDEGKSNAMRLFANSKPTLNVMQSTFDGIVSSLKSSEKTVTQNNNSSGSGSGSSKSSKGDYIGMQSPISDAMNIAPGYTIGDNNYGGNSGYGVAFYDLNNYRWAYEAISSLYSSGIISGYGNGKFAPQNNIKREEFVKIVVSAFYKDADAGTCDFSDVSEGTWYYKNISIAVNNGIISGMGENLFGIGKYITRQDMAVILYRIAGDKLEKPENYTAFSDDYGIAAYAKDAVYALRAAGVINGVSDSEFAPEKNATRAETAVMVYRFLNLVGEEGV